MALFDAMARFTRKRAPVRASKQNDLQEVLVYGIRASLRESLESKRQAMALRTT